MIPTKNNMMGDRRHKTHLVSPFAPFLLLVLLNSLGSVFVGAYKNYTVGDSMGWYDTSEKAGVDYQKWATGKNFSLGDFLIFNTNNNHSVVQTYNVTTYNLCDYDDTVDNDTMEWSSADPSNTATQPVTVAVPLLKEGPTYFFSGDYDGDQCKSGQRFKLSVSHGKGLPDSLKNPEDQAPAPNAADTGDDVPDTVMPSNFDHPNQQQGNDDDDDSDNANQKSGSVPLLTKSSQMIVFSVALLMLGTFGLFDFFVVCV